jgi:hypothetical protein
MTKKEQRRAAYQEKCRAANPGSPPPAPKAKRSRRAFRRTEDSRIANHIDGFDRDDLGESPDF